MLVYKTLCIYLRISMNGINIIWLIKYKNFNFNEKIKNILRILTKFLRILATFEKKILVKY